MKRTLFLLPIIWKPCDASTPSTEEQGNHPLIWLPQMILDWKIRLKESEHRRQRYTTNLLFLEYITKLRKSKKLLMIIHNIFQFYYFSEMTTHLFSAWCSSRVHTPEYPKLDWKAFYTSRSLGLKYWWQHLSLKTTDQPAWTSTSPSIF